MPPLVLAMVLVLLLAAGGTAFAHRMLIERVESGLIQVRYDDGTRAGLAGVTLYDGEGNIIAEGPADEEGFFHYDPVKRPNRIVADDGMGHRARWMEGEIDRREAVPRWQRVLLGVSVFVFIAALANYFMRKKHSIET